jgi:hypothetical protein
MRTELIFALEVQFTKPGIFSVSKVALGMNKTMECCAGIFKQPIGTRND